MTLRTSLMLREAVELLASAMPCFAGTAIEAGGKCGETLQVANDVISKHINANTMRS